MIELQTKVTNTKGRIIDLGSDDYAVNEPVSTKRTIQGNGARIFVAKSTESAHPAIVLRGTNPRLLGRVQLVGPAEHGAPYIPELEAQHAIRIEGAVSPEVGAWHISNFHGDAIYAGRDNDRQWTTNLWVHDTHFDEIGRHAITPDAVLGARWNALDIQRVNLSIVDIEPPGNDWGCTNLRWTNSVVHDSGGNYILASRGVGNSGSVHDITLEGIHCLRRPFSVTAGAVPKPGDPVIRRQRFTIRNCSGVGVARQPQLLFRHVDGVTVENVTQEMVGPLVFTNDCSNVKVTP